jgi:type I restriction enzyme S subunit
LISDWNTLLVQDAIDDGILLVEDGNHGEYRPLAHEFVPAAGTPFVRPDDLKEGRVAFGACDLINAEATKRVRKGHGRPRDVLFTHRATVGRMALVRDSDPVFVANPGVTVWRSLDEAKIDHRFLYYSMQTDAFMHQVWAVAGSTDTFPYVSLTQQRRLKLLLPPHGEQVLIGDCLAALDDKIDLNRFTNETLEAMAQAIFKDWFVDFGPTRAKLAGTAPYWDTGIWSGFPDQIDADGLPVGWSVCGLADIADLNPSERLPQGTEAPYLDMASLPVRGSWPDKPMTRAAGSGARFRNGDTLVARITPCLENGKTAFVSRLSSSEVAWGSTEFIVIRPRAPFPAEYGYLLARHDAFRAHAIQSMTGTSGRQRVQPESLRNFPVIRPPDRLVRHFGELVKGLFAQIAANELEAETLAAIRDLLLPKLMSGELRVREAEKITEVVL